MKRRILLFLLTAVLISTAFLSSCGYNEPEQAAADLLDDCIACQPEALAAVMGYDILALTDIERYTLTRMKYNIVGSTQLDQHRWDVTFDTELFDIMNLLNEALVFSLMADAEQPDTNHYVLQKLNSEEAARANFRAVLPMICAADGTWSVDTARIGDDVRDAVSGGAYSWYAAYRETFEAEDTPTQTP